MINNNTSIVMRFIADEDGAILVEYTLLLLLVAIAALIGIKSYGQAVANKMGGNNNSVANAIQ